MRSLLEGFSEKYVVSQDGCWNWTAGTNGVGYGLIRPGGLERAELAHRVAWKLVKGYIPPSICVLHRCDNPRCVNPSHLFLGTHADNASDRDKKGRGGHKLNPEQVREILKRSSCGETTSALARAYNVDRSTVKNIKYRRTWKHEEAQNF